MRTSKVRADALLTAQGLAENTDKAARLIMAGQVCLCTDTTQTLVDKPGQLLPSTARLEVCARERFVSRGGEKLQSALEHFALDMRGVVALDAGASTGGFTDCLLQAGAVRVYAVDVGHGQLHWKLRQDARVINMERINLRLAPPDLLPEQVDVLVVDCSFISLKQILPPCLSYVRPGGQMLALIKPQFEVHARDTDKGVVRSEALRLQAVADIEAFVRDQLGLIAHGSIPAGIKGPKGNQEYILYCSLRSEDAPPCDH
ncbi:TlyA family rRNA (cytidine-2'-O)-methyltransferase [Desulfovibrionales bacterium]